MSQTNLLKLLEVGVLLLALGVFVWWQMRDLKQAREATARQRAMEATPAATSHPSNAPGTPGTPDPPRNPPAS